MMNYKVTRRFLNGLLAGMEITCTTSVQFTKGLCYREALTGSEYVITSVEVL